jgi:hypothetical protein
VILSRAVRICLWVAAVVVASLAVTAAILIARFQPMARDYIVAALRERYKSDVQLGNLQITLFPSVHAVGDNLVLRLADRPGIPPMIVIRRFTIDAQLPGFFSYPKRIDRVRLEGLQIHIPPKSPAAGHSSPITPFVLAEVVADGTTLETLPTDPKKEPLTFAIHKLTLHSVGPRRPMTFRAELENAKPPGLIHSDGDFGPWDQDEPGDTPVDGKYTFSNADLSVFKGIRGTLASTGDYRGQLNRIDVHGVTEVPAFSLTTGGRALPLHTEFDATVDGTNGDTLLHPVHARLGRSAFEVSGSIERRALETHKEIYLEARAKNTGIEDFLRLAISGAAPMKGRIGFDTKVRIPPGQTPVIGRMQLAGEFMLRDVTFTSAQVQQKIAGLSHHAEGQPKDTDVTGVLAQFAGRFSLRGGVLTLPQLIFEVPGANVTLDGTYKVQSGDIDFRGTAKLDATISQMTTGMKHVLLKPFDPLFRREGAGTVLPITITGTRGNPSFHVEIGRALKRKDAPR